MSNPSAPLTSSNQGPSGPASETYFHQQRALLVSEIASALDTTLTHLNRLNRSLESVIGIGNEFSNVEALWSQFEGVMGSGAAQGGKGKEEGAKDGEGESAVEGESERESKLDTPPVARGAFGRG